MNVIESRNLSYYNDIHHHSVKDENPYAGKRNRRVVEDTKVQTKSAAQLFRERFSFLRELCCPLYLYFRQKENQERLLAEVHRLQEEIEHYSNQVKNLKEENEAVKQRQMFLRYFLQEVVSNHAFVEDSGAK